MPTVSRLNLWTLWDRRQPGRAYDAVLPMAFASNGWCGYFLLRRLHVRFLQGN